MYALFDRVLESVFAVELCVSPYGVNEQRVLCKRFAGMQYFTSLIIIDIYHADNEFERRFADVVIKASESFNIVRSG